MIAAIMVGGYQGVNKNDDRINAKKALDLMELVDMEVG